MIKAPNDHKLIAFIHIPKCGGTTLNNVLRREYMLDHFDVLPADKSPAAVFTPEDMRCLLKLNPGLKSVVPGISYYTLLRGRRSKSS